MPSSIASSASSEPVHDPWYEEWIRKEYPNPDGEDYDPEGKYFWYRRFLTRVRTCEWSSEEDKARRIKYLKELVFPLW
jgi:hypothetical protein